MSVWVVRAGKHGEGEDFAINQQMSGISFGLRKDIAEFPTRDTLRQHLESSKAADQLWRFAHDVQVGETVVLPCKLSRLVAVGKVTGGYRYEADFQFPHIRPVKWDAVDIPRASFDQDLMSSFGALSTIFRVSRPNAQERIERVTRRHNGEVLDDSPVTVDLTDDGDIAFDWDEVISAQIIERVRQKFTGHGLEYLVESILKAQGYTTLLTGQGPDGGIDIVAGKGEMGFEEPRLCVQVKSVAAPVGLADYNRLQGNMIGIDAHHGLLVSLSDFTRAVHGENRRSFFQVRLWGPGELVRNLLNTYDRLPAEIRADIPLADRKVLMETEA